VPAIASWRSERGCPGFVWIEDRKRPGL